MLLAALVLFASCKKEAQDQPVAASAADVIVPYSEASYKMTVVLNWQNPQFAVPALFVVDQAKVFHVSLRMW